MYEGTGSYHDQCLVIKKGKYFLKDRINLKFEKEIRENEIKYIDLDNYDTEHSQILVCYTDKTPEKLNIKCDLVGNDTIKLQKIDIPLGEYKQQLFEEYGIKCPCYDYIYYINPNNELYFTHCAKGNNLLIKTNKIKRMGSPSACANLRHGKEKFEDC